MGNGNDVFELIYIRSYFQSTMTTRSRFQPTKSTSNQHQPCGNVTVALAIVQPERLLQLLLHRFRVLLLYQEVGGNIGEPIEVDLPRVVRVLFVDQVLQLALVKLLAERVQDRRDLDRLDQAALGRVEHLERLAHDDQPLLLIFLWNNEK